MNFVALDVETAIGKRYSICQIGLAFVENGEIVKTYSRLVRPPQNEYSYFNIRIHGITPEDTATEAEFPAIWNEIFPLIKGQKLVAHNSSFDLSCFRQALDYYNLDSPSFDCDCTYKITGQKLNIACDNLGIEFNNHHDACADAIACAQIYLKHLSGKMTSSKKSSNTYQNTAKTTWGSSEDILRGDILKMDLSQANPSSPFYRKKVVFTGILKQYSRLEAALLIKKMGADICTGISKKTDFVIVGKAPGPAKLKKIDDYNHAGSNIIRLNEEQFRHKINAL